VIAVCYELQQFSFQRYVPWYYNKETIQNIWTQTIQGYLVQGSFTKNPKENVVHIPNPDTQLCQGVRRWKNKRIRNNMDEAEAGAAVVMCYKCLGTGHTYKRCTTTSYACNAPPTCSVGSSVTSGPSQAPSGCGRGRGRRTNAGFRWSAYNVRAINFGICNIWTIFVVWTYAWYCIVIIELLFVLFCRWLFTLFQ
jgi:hypothetical protein